MQVKPLPPEHYENIPETPVVLRSLDPESKQAALRYGEQLNRVLAPTGVEASLHGSTELELAGNDGLEHLGISRDFPEVAVGVGEVA